MLGISIKDVRPRPSGDRSALCRHGRGNVARIAARTVGASEML